MEWNKTLILNEQTNWVISDESAGVRITALSLPPREKPGLFLAKDLTSWFIRWGVIVGRLIISAIATVGPMRHRCCIVSAAAAAAACPIQCRSCIVSATTMGSMRHQSYTVFATIVGPMRRRWRIVSATAISPMRRRCRTVTMFAVAMCRVCCHVSCMLQRIHPCHRSLAMSVSYPIHANSVLDRVRC